MEKQKIERKPVASNFKELKKKLDKYRSLKLKKRPTTIYRASLES
ncbi:hypothetical protein [Aquimarina rhabdastrellae]